MAVQINNLLLARQAAWPDALLVPTVRPDDLSWNTVQRGKAPGQPITPGEPRARGLHGWQNHIAPEILEAAELSGFGMGILTGKTVNGEQVFAIDVDTELSPGSNATDTLSEDEYLAAARIISNQVQETLEAVTEYVEWRRETRPGRAAFILRVPASVNLGRKMQFHISRDGVYHGKIELLQEGNYLASVGTYARSMQPITWHCQGEAVPIPNYDHISRLETSEAVNSLMERTMDDLKALGFTWSPKAPRAPKAERRKRIATEGATPKGMRSEVAHDTVMDLCADGFSHDEVATALAHSPDSGMREWLDENGGPEGRQFTRLWQKGRALQIAVEILNEHKLTLDEDEMYAKAVLAWCQDFDSYRWYADRGVSGKDDSEARLTFAWAVSQYGRIDAQDAFPPVCGPKTHEDEFAERGAAGVTVDLFTQHAPTPQSTASLSSSPLPASLLPASPLPLNPDEFEPLEAAQTEDTTDEPKAPRKGLPAILSISGLEDLPPPEWLIHDMMPRRGLAVVYGPPKSYKTFLALSAMLHVAAGKPWFGRAVSPGVVVYIAGEGIGGLSSRIGAMRIYHGFPSNIPFLIIPRAVNFADQKAVISFKELVTQTVGQTPVAAIVVDTLARSAFGIDENDSKDMGLLIRSYDFVKEVFDCLVVVVHHSGKDLARGMRGSSALHGALDVSFSVKKENDAIIFTNIDQKEGDIVEPLYFDLLKRTSGDGRPMSIVPVLRDEKPYSPPPKAEDRLSEGNQRILQALRHTLSIEGEMRPRGPNGKDLQMSATMRQWKEAYREMRPTLSADTNDKAIRRGIETLLAEGIVIIQDQIVWIADEFGVEPVDVLKAA